MTKQLLLCLALLLAAGCSADTAPTAGTGDSAAIASAGSSAAAHGSPAASAPTGTSVTVTRIIDGDTVEVTVDGRKETVRMILVDTPETKKPNTPVQPFGLEASAFAEEMLKDQEVRLERDVSTTDRYGRSLYYIWIGDKMFNELLLEKGLARVSVYPPDVKYVERFREIQEKARKAEAGIWSIENYASEQGYDGSLAASSASPANRPSAPASQPVGPSAPVAVKPAEPSASPAAKTSGPTASIAAKASETAASAGPRETPKPSPSTTPQEVYYKNCTEAKAAGVYNIREGQPGYRAALDRDNDGIACEK
jgi:micrococcal nuclease